MCMFCTATLVSFVKCKSERTHLYTCYINPAKLCDSSQEVIFKFTFFHFFHFQRYSKVFEKLEKKVDKENIVEEKLFVQIQNLGPKDVFVSCIC